MSATDARWAEAERASEARHGARLLRMFPWMTKLDAWAAAVETRPVRPTLLPESALTWPLYLAAQGGITPAERFLLVGAAPAPVRACGCPA